LLIVLEGLDGSGKSTQLRLLEAWLRGQGYAPLAIKLPHYEEESSVLVRQYLAGRFGEKPGDVNAYAAAAFYAVDRYAGFRSLWETSYRAGRIILADRYTGSNAYHQATKLPKAAWESYFSWLEDFEYAKLGVPKPDLVLYLDMPPELSRRLLSKRYEGDESRRDLHETDFAYLLACRETALAAVDAMGWQKIDCAANGAIDSPEELHARIRSCVKRLLSGSS
jgi:dTMP kinase